MKFADKGDLETMNEFEKCLGKRQKQTFSIGSLTKGCILNNDRDAFMELLRGDPEGNNVGNWIIGSKIINEASQAHPDFVDKLDSLVKENNIPAKIFVAKLALLNEDYAKVDELWEGIGDKKDVLLGDVNSLVKYDLISSKLEGSSPLLSTLTNACLSNLFKEKKENEILQITQKFKALSVSLTDLKR